MKKLILGLAVVAGISACSSETSVATPEADAQAAKQNLVKLINGATAVANLGTSR